MHLASCAAMNSFVTPPVDAAWPRSILGSFSRAVDAAVAYARYRLQRGKEGFESEPEADGEDGEEPQASAKAERPVEPVALHADVDADAEAARWEEEGEAAAMLLSEARESSRDGPR